MRSIEPGTSRFSRAQLRPIVRAAARPGMTVDDRRPICANVGPITAAKRAAREDAMDDRARNSSHLMLITPERVFYAGLLGRPRERCPGAFHVYVAIRGGLSLSTADGEASHGELAVTMPNLRHTIASEHRAAICVAIEPESVCDGVLDAWRRRLSGAE